MNAYSPNIEEFEKYYEALPNGDVNDATRSISLTHPYKTLDDVEKALEKSSSFAERENVYSKMTPSLRGNDEAMLKLIQKDARVYAYSINRSREFNIKAIEANTQTYALLPASERDTKEISDAYITSMRGQMSRAKINPSEWAMMYKHKFSQDISTAQMGSLETYRQAYMDMVVNGAYVNGAYGQNAVIIATARMMAKDNPELLKQYDDVEKDIWYDNIGRNRLKEAAYSDRTDRENNEMLLAAVERCPEIQPSVQRQQEQYKVDKEQMIKLTMADELGIQLEPHEREMMQNLQLKKIEINKQEKERMQKVVQKAREESAYYLQRDSVEDIYAAYVRGDTSLSDATLGAGKVQGLQSHGSHSKVVEMAAQATDLEQHHAQDISDPRYSPGSERDVEEERIEEEQKIAENEEQDQQEEQELSVDEQYEEFLEQTPGNAAFYSFGDGITEHVYDTNNP